MQLLVSVRTAAEAHDACAGGADVIDAKDPSAGALGAVSIDDLRLIVAAVAGSRMVTAALGDAGDAAAVESAARQFAAAGAALVKIGFAQVTSQRRVSALIAAAVRGAKSGSNRAGVVAVAYADHAQAASVHPDMLLDAAIASGAAGVLLDTADKEGPGACALLPLATRAAWASRAHAAGLLVAMAGRLTEADLPLVRDAGADVAGVRGAACDGGRGGRVSLERVRRLAARCASLAAPAAVI